MIQPRLRRYKKFLENDYINWLLRNNEYELSLNKELEEKIRNKQFKRIVFTWMWCSAIVSDIIKWFFVYHKIPIYVEVINDYEIEYLVDEEIFKDGKTLVIISSYSGYSQEPINAYYRIKKFTKNIIFLTSNGKLASIWKKDNVSLIYWRIVNPDREYPLLHATQYFSILLDVFYKLGTLYTNYYDQLSDTVKYLKNEFNDSKVNKAKQIAENLIDKNIILLASPKWYLTLLKLVKMHLNEIAMVPAHRNYIHEFWHSEIASLTDPKIKHSLLIFSDNEYDDDYTRQKIKVLIDLFSQDIKENKNISVNLIEMNQNNFLKKFFSTLLFVQYITYYLWLYYNTKSREIISIAAGNPWYNINTIKKDLGFKAEDYYLD